MKPVTDPSILALFDAPAANAAPAPAAASFGGMRAVNDPAVLELFKAPQETAAAAVPAPAAPQPAGEEYNIPGVGTLVRSGDDLVPAQTSGDAAAQGGAVANFGAGVSETIGGLLGFPMAGLRFFQNQPEFGDQVGIPSAEQVIGYGARLLPTVTGETPGTPEWNQRKMGEIGYDPSTVEAKDAGDRLARGTGRGVAAGLPFGLAGTVIGGLSGMTGATAAEATPEGKIRIGTNAKGEPVEIDQKSLADFVGQLAGGGIPALAETGVRTAGRKIAATTAPARAPFSEAGRGQTVSDTLRTNATKPEELVDALSVKNPELVQGSKPTTYQLTGDTGLGVLERGVAAKNPAPFIERRAEQNAARTQAVDEMAPAVAQPGRVTETIENRLKAINDEFDNRTNVAASERDTAVQNMGGQGERAAYGEQLRTTLEEAKKIEKAKVSALYKEIDPDETLALDVTPIQQAVKQIQSEMKKAEQLSPDEARLHGVLESMPKVEQFSELTALRGEILSAIRNERFTNGETKALRRLTQLRGAIDGAIEGAAKGAEAPAVAPRPATKVSGPQMNGHVYTPGGLKVDTQFEVVDLAGPNAPVVSHTQDFTSNPKFPAELQPRDRGRAASEAQVTKMAGNLNPERLGAGGVGEGAPIIGPDGVVESGNGRTLAVQRAHQAGGKKSREYKDWLAAQGYDTTGMKQPILVRRRTSEMTPEQRLQFVNEANSGPGLKLSAVEQASADAGRLTDDVLDQYRGGAIDAPENRGFARAFVGKLGGGGEVGGLAAKDGTLSIEGARRMQAAMLGKAFGADDALVRTLLETGDDNIKALGRALTDAAPGIAKLKAAIARGDIPKDFDPTKALTDAARVVQQARKAGQPISDILAQQDAFNPLHPMTERFLKAAYGENLSRVSYGRASEALKTYLDEAGRQTGGDMFGGGPSAADVWGAASRKASGVADDVAPAAKQDLPATVEPAGPATIIPDELAPNFSPDDAAKYRKAATANREMAEKFKGGPVGNVLHAGPGGADYKVANSEVAKKLFNGGGRAKEDAEAFVKAGGTASQLYDYAASDLRSFAVKPDGSLDPKRWRMWMDKHFEGLRALDRMSGNTDMRTRFMKASEAQKVVDDLGVERTRTVAEFQESAAKFYLRNEDPVTAIGEALASRNAVGAMDELRSLIGSDHEALSGLRRGVIEHLKNKFVSNAEAADSGLGLWKADQVQTYIKQHRQALSRVFEADQMKVLDGFVADLQRANRSIAGAKLPGGSNTTQDVLAAARAGSNEAVSVFQALTEAGSAAAGAAVGGVGGAAAGSWIGRNMGGKLSDLVRKMGPDKMDRLLEEAVLDPQLARALLHRYPPQQIPPAVVNWLERRLVVQVPVANEASGTEEKRAANGR